MLEKARLKHPQVAFRQAEAARLPFTSCYFDFIYMTDVIHHIPDITALFAEIKRVLKPGSSACIVTQSHQQIACRPVAQFFPGTITVDQGRYPDIPAIKLAGEQAGLQALGIEILGAGDDVELGPEFFRLVKVKGYSMLHLISDEEYNRGVQVLEKRLHSGPIQAKAAGGSLVWFEKPDISSN